MQQSNIQQVHIRSLSERIEGKPLTGLNMASAAGGHLNIHYDKMNGQQTDILVKSAGKGNYLNESSSYNTLLYIN